MAWIWKVLDSGDTVRIVDDLPSIEGAREAARFREGSVDKAEEVRDATLEALSSLAELSSCGSMRSLRAVNNA
jgi:hypothetical protein